ncbi:MAG TPA: enoyl-CoA hydratase/isomerase family protein [Candidatus Binataceae bacterium]|nr:enoyl-CoA hydratase/isomerase family protein [Candidatus Binataceae bacterium]
MATEYQTILTRREGAAQIITMNRPERRNAVSMRMMEELAGAAVQAEEDPAVRAVIITGGEKFFSAGADLNEALAVKSPPAGIEYLGRWHRLNSTLEKLAKPVIAAIEGFCMTGGCEMALACDLRIAGEGASFAITSARIGTVAGAGGTQRLPRIVGMAKALELMFAAEPIDAAEAHRIGLVNRLVPAGSALKEAQAMVAVYEKRAPMSLALIKRAVRQGMQMDLASGLELETFLVTTIYGTEDKNEGISAFLEKREASFKGR